MPRRITQSLIYGICVTLAFLLSFRAYAPHLTANLNSDNAVHILMAYDLKLPSDLYYWGQDRLGSLLPILSHGLLKISHLSAAEAVAVVQYGLLLIGYLSLSSLFQSLFSKLVFAGLWFLPILDFNALISVAQPYGPQFALIGLAIVLVRQIKLQSGKLFLFKNQLLVFGAGLCLAISLWVSDLSIILIVLFLGSAILFALQHLAQASWESQAETDSLIATLKIPVKQIPFLLATGCNFLIVIGLGFAFIAYAKHQSTSLTNYSSFSSLSEIQITISKLWQALFQTLTFRAYSPFLSLSAGLTVILLGYLSYLYYQQVREQKLPRSYWFYLFAISAISGMLLLTISRWVYRNDVSLRYFVFVYLCGWIAVLLFSESLAQRTQRIVKILVSLILICSLMSSAQPVFALTPPVSKLEQLRAFKSLGKAGLIGEYWSSYILCAADPKHLTCTPKDPKGQIPCQPDPKPQRPIRGVRCPRCARKVLKSEQIYLVQNDWFESFPAEIQQFGICLVKTGEPLQLAGYNLAAYRQKPQA